MVVTAVREITLDWLREHDACKDQVELFKATFGTSAELSRANVMLAATVGLDIDWLAQRLLDAAAWRAYEEAKDTAWRAYREDTDTITTERAWVEAAARRACVEAAARLACEEAEAMAWLAYKKAMDTALQTYRTAVAPTLCDALLLPRSEGSS